MATFREDVEFLSKHTEVIVLDARRPAVVAVAPELGGRVMTSSPAGQTGQSLGWVNRPFIESGSRNTAFDNYGGEDRFWLGPEAGQFALWFTKGEKFDQAHWKTPAGLNAGAFAVTSRGKGSVALAARFNVANYSGTQFECAVKRIVDVLSRDQMAAALGVTIPAELSAVAFSTTNTLANVGGQAWRRETGLLSLWILGQFPPLPEGFVVAPFLGGRGKDLGPMPTGDYFGKVPPERFALKKDHLLFKVDGRYRSKLGIAPGRAANVIGSYDPAGGMLTVVQYNLPAAAGKLPYVNSLWEKQSEPYVGDVINSYNDAGGLGGFYELETSSPAAELAVNESLTHVHSTFHFTGPAEQLFRLGRDVLGVDLRKVKF